MSMPDAATCQQCGSTRIRHSRSRTVVHRLLRAVTDLDRYACGACGHRGWRWGKLDHRERTVEPAAVPLPGRRSERRDVRLKRRRAIKAALTVSVALALGVVAAFIIMRMSMDPARPPEP